MSELAPRFDALRELLISPASALVTIENTAGKFFAGQTVYSDLIPQTPVALPSPPPGELEGTARDAMLIELAQQREAIAASRIWGPYAMKVRGCGSSTS